MVNILTTKLRVTATQPSVALLNLHKNMFSILRSPTAQRNNYVHRHRRRVHNCFTALPLHSICTYFLQKYVRPIILSQTCSSPSRTAADRFELKKTNLFATTGIQTPQRPEWLDNSLLQISGHTR